MSLSRRVLYYRIVWTTMTNDSVILNACTFFSRSSSRPSTLPGSARTPVGAPRRNATISASQFHEIHAVLLTLRCVSSVYYKRPAGPTQQDRVRRRINYQSLFLRSKTFWSRSYFTQQITDSSVHRVADKYVHGFGPIFGLERYSICSQIPVTGRNNQVQTYL